MSGRRRATLSPTLFPFLAVLVCTLGTLILFLALVAQKADDTAQESADKSEVNEALVTKIQDAHWSRDRYVAMRESQTEELQEQTSQLTHIEDHLRRLRQQLHQLEKESMAAIDNNFDISAENKKIEELKTEIAAEKERVSKLADEIGKRPPRVVIVPHQGPNGTEQRPIYVECTAEGLRLQPEGSFISLMQLEEAQRMGNPLDAALRTIRYHWQQIDPEGPTPYPLLVVRPDGIASYSAARIAMSSWDDQFGYELIPAEMELAFPRGDASLKQRVDVAIREAVARQHANMASASYTRARLSQSGRPPRVLSAADLARGGTGSGSGARYFARPSTAPSGGPPGTGIDNNDIRNFDSALAATAATAPETGPFGNNTGNNGAAAGINGSAMGAGSNLPGGYSTGSPSLGGSSNPATLAGGPQGANPGSQNRGSITENQSLGWSGQPGDPGDGQSGDAPDRRATGTGAVDADGEWDGQSLGASTPGQNAVGGTGGSQRGSSASGSTTAPPPGATAGQGSATAKSSTAQGPPSKPGSKTQLQRGGKDWALPSSARQPGTEIVRGLSVICSSDAFLLVSDQKNGTPQRFGFEDGFVDRAAMQLATAVHDRVDGWGVAIAGGRWQPLLRVQVEPNAETRFRQLQVLLQRSGLEIEKR
ncbi:IncA protein [Roseimaritima multifibrata]|uniref:IncA protein n=1 Tax=Roseimaritima multifibrata TaxID=1930274 RepID=A0A517MMU2_9BACT|nr:IncA protein [Roseimaritima multifibrata]